MYTEGSYYQPLTAGRRTVDNAKEATIAARNVILANVLESPNVVQIADCVIDKSSR